MESKDDGGDSSRLTTAMNRVDVTTSTDAAFAVIWSQDAASYMDVGVEKELKQLGLSPSMADAELDPGRRGKELVGKGLDTVHARLATVCSRLVRVCATLA